MFNRSQSGYLEKLNIEENLHRFEEDVYATTYLVGCFNPEFKVRVSAPRESPVLASSGVISTEVKQYFNEEVF